MRRRLWLVPVLLACFAVCYAKADIQNSPSFGVASFPSALVSIEDEAFQGTSFQVIVIHEGLTRLGVNAFEGNGNLHTAILPKSLVYIGEGALPVNDRLTIYAPWDSTTQDWAEENRVRFIRVELLYLLKSKNSVAISSDADEEKPALREENEGNVTSNKVLNKPALRRRDRPEMDIPEAEIP